MEQQIDIQQRKYNIIAVTGTLLVHSLLFLLCYFIFFYTPIPPWPESGGGGGLGIEVNLGTSETGFGDLETANISMPDFTSSSQNNLLTSNDDESSSINDNSNNNKDINQAAIYKGKKNGQSQGENGGPGNQGKKDGDPNSSNYKGKGNGGTGGGTGGGNGTGDGPGDGPGKGPGKGGVSFVMNGRTAKSLPKPNYNSKEEGTVVVTIWVDKKGKVTKALAGGRGTTTTNQSLWKLATDAALRATFDVKADAPEEQKGTITYNFINLN